MDNTWTIVISLLLLLPWTLEKVKHPAPKIYRKHNNRTFVKGERD